jgi:transposase
MAKTFREWKVDECWLLPPSVSELVPEGHPAHLIRNTVRDVLDLSGIFAAYDEERGAPPFHPTMMTALLLYAYSQGVYSSRKIARGCEQRVDFMAVTGLAKPDFRTIGKFRVRHLAALEDLFQQVLELCRKAGLVRLGHVALDGTKIKANASKHKAMSYGRMKQREKELRKQVREILEQAEREDQEEDERFGADLRGDELPEHLRTKQAQLAAIQKAKAELEEEARQEAQAAGREPEEATVPDKKQRNFTDPESRILKTNDGFIQGYNAQAAADAAHQIVVACDVVQSGSDVLQLQAMVEQIEENLGATPTEMSADAGYFSAANVELLEAKGIEPLIAPERQRHGEGYEAGPRGRIPKRLTLRERMARKLRTKRGRESYAKRKITVEPVFGQIKHARGFRQFLMRGIGKVSGEFALLCTVHNLLKWIDSGGWRCEPVLAT